MQWQPPNLTASCPAHSEITACSPLGYMYLSLIVQLYSGSKDARIQEKIHQCPHEEVEKDEEYDFIIVGAGAAGCVLANRLSAFEQWKVLVLEAGTEQPDVSLVPGLATAMLGSSVDWGYTTMPDGRSCLARPGQACSWPRGKMMGGSSSINSFAYIRGNKLDYDHWAELGNDGWSYEEVLPYFKKSERNLNIEGLDRKYHGVHGEQSVQRLPYTDKPSLMLIEAFQERGIPIRDYNAAYQVGAMKAQETSEDGERVSANNAFMQPIRYKRKNLTVRVKSEVTKILINKQKVAYGVKYVKDGRAHRAYARKEVIVSGGSINSPKLLMLSGIGPKKHLSELNITVKQDLAVGENLHDHVTFNGIIVVLPNRTATTVSGDELLQELRDYKKMEHKDGPLASQGPVNSISFIKTDPDLPAPDVQYQYLQLLVNEYASNMSLYESVNIFPPAYYNGVSPRAMNLVPKSRGKLLLNPDDPNGKPLIYANYFADPSDFIPIIKGLKFFFTFEHTETFKRYGAYFLKKSLYPCEHYEWGTDEYIICMARAYTSSTYHPVGTCKMGPSCDDKAVVNPKLKVYGISRLRVIDASIMPVVNRGNTVAPTMMIAEKGAAFIIDEWLNKY
nr:glucose dehydrogenase [FAD, quinone] [Helicoverpa armigera]